MDLKGLIKKNKILGTAALNRDSNACACHTLPGPNAALGPELSAASQKSPMLWLCVVALLLVRPPWQTFRRS